MDENRIERIAIAVCKGHEVSVHTKSVWPRITGTWVVDGKETTYRGMRKLIIPFLKDEMIIEPRLVKSVLWKILIRATKQPISSRNE